MAIVQTVNARAIQDTNLSVTTALPAQGASVTSTAFDTGDNTNGIFPEFVDLLVTVPSTPSLASGGVITFTVLADTASTPTTVLSPSLTATVTGTAGNGAASSFRWKVPYNAGRYIGVQASCGTTTGNNISVSYTTQLLF